MATTKIYEVKRQPGSRNYGIFEVSTGVDILVEGGFFSKHAALNALLESARARRSSPGW